jgi:hypothetical protein
MSLTGYKKSGNCCLDYDTPPDKHNGFIYNNLQYLIARQVIPVHFAGRHLSHHPYKALTLHPIVFITIIEFTPKSNIHRVNRP